MAGREGQTESLGAQVHVREQTQILGLSGGYPQPHQEEGSKDRQQISSDQRGQNLRDPVPVPISGHQKTFRTDLHRVGGVAGTGVGSGMNAC